ncbi:MAG: fumarylacetoacetate hydrolase family protein [Pseudomonadota bacterium]
MRFLSFRTNSESARASFGAVVGEGVVDLGARFADVVDLRDALRQDRLAELAAAAADATVDFSLRDIDYLPTIPNPEKIICIGVNYANRNAEYRDDSELPEYPSVFMRTRESLVGHEQSILDPPESEQLDYEGEIVLVVGRSGRRIPEARAHEYVAGTTIMNEGSVRDYLRHAKFNVTQGKNFANSGSLGPWLVTSDELDPFGNLQVITRVNGEERQNDVTANLMFSFRYLLSYLSSFYHLQPGDVIATGTPNGAGARFDPPRYLKPQDQIEVEVPGIGVLANGVVAEAVADSAEFAR